MLYGLSNFRRKWCKITSRRSINSNTNIEPIEPTEDHVPVGVAMALPEKEPSVEVSHGKKQLKKGRTC